MNAEKYIVKSHDSIEVIPKMVEYGNQVNKYLNYMFLTWSTLVVILYFAGVNIPDEIDVGVGLSSIILSALYYLYITYIFKEEHLYKVAPALEKRKNIFTPIFPST